VNIEKKWLKIVSLALSLPATIFASVWISRFLVQEEIVEEWLGDVIFLSLVCNIIFLIVFYAIKNQNKS
jgi:hypothetical protein